jgi:response regulator NasT
MRVLVSRLGHFPIACELGPESVAVASSARRPDVALVGVDVDERDGLEAITEIVRLASCPVIALLETHSAERIAEAAERGIFAYVVDADEDDLRGALEVTLRRFWELESLRRAFGRRATIEQAKGILMARHAVDEQRAFELLRAHSQRSGRKVAELAEAIVQSHALLLQPAELGNSDKKLAKSDGG